MDAQFSATTQTPIQGPTRGALIFIVITAFLSSIGFGILNPVAPFLVSRYVSDPNSVGIVLGWLTSIYAVCQFLAAPALGAFSDKFGRRSVLLFCMFGSAVGYLLLGLGGALWVLFLGRIIDGITGANMSVSFAYIADLTPPGQRGKYFGMMGALFGIGFIVGPAIGGFLSQFGYEVPFYVAAALTFANVIYGLFGMPESLPKEKRSAISAAHLNPFSALINVVSVRQIRWILLATFLYGVPFAALSVNIALFPKDALSWGAAEIGLIFAIVGITDIVVQGVLLQLLFKRFSESQIAIGGLVAEIIGYLLIASIAVVHSPLPLLVGTVIFAMGDGLLGPSLSGLLSRVAGSQSQGQVQGASQSVQSLSRIAGPFLGGLMYDYVGHASPFIAGAVIAVIAIITLLPILTTLQQVLAEQPSAGETSSQPAAG